MQNQTHVVEEFLNGELVQRFEVDNRDVVGSWLDHTNAQLNKAIRLIGAECVLDYWQKKDEHYVNPDAPMICYVECEKHGPQIGDRFVYPTPSDDIGSCPKCGDDIIMGIKDGSIPYRPGLPRSFN